MVFEKPVVVIDNGSYSIKAGFSCDNHPVSIFRTLVGRPNYLHGTYGRDYYEVCIGDDTIDADDLELSHPLVHGKISDWDNIERIWHHVFYKELKVAPEDRSVILACGPAATLEEKIKCCEIFFETLNAPALCMQSQNVLAMYGSGVTTGLCVDFGYSTTKIMPVFEGGMISYTEIDTGLGGLHISEYIKKSLEERELLQALKVPEDIENIQKECYVTQNCAMPRNKYDVKYKISNEKEIDVTNEVFMAAEMLFQPLLTEKGETKYIPLQDAIVTAALKCDDELRLELYEAIVPCGGLSLIPGLNGRLECEMKSIVNESVSILSSPEPYTVSWLGGAVFAGLSDTEKLFILKNQFEEQGGRIVKNKFM